MSYPAERVRRRRSSRRRNAIQYTAGVLVLLIVTGFGVWSVFRRYSSASSSSVASSSGVRTNAGQNLLTLVQQALPSEPFARSQWAVYPYSVVPGGVRTPQELLAASDHDHIVATHYAGFDFRKARLIRVKQAKLVYLSYRIGDKIFWTRKRMSLRVGETLITDGRFTARTRCGNQVSAAPHIAISPAEPSVETLDQLITEPTAPPVPFESAILQPPGFGTAALPPPLGGLPPGPPPIGGGGCPPGHQCFPPPPPNPPPVNMAEPDAPSLLGSVVLFWLGVAGVCAHRWKLRSKAPYSH